MTTLTSDSIARHREHPATAPQTHGRLQSAWGRCFAAIYEPLMQATENGGNAARRAAVLAHARGTVVELGAGTGLNLPHYPPTSSSSSPNPSRRWPRRLLERLQQSGRQARVLQAPADRIPLPDGSVDTVVCTLVLCTVPDLDATLTEIRRLLQAGRTAAVHRARRRRARHPAAPLAGPARAPMAPARPRLPHQP